MACGHAQPPNSFGNVASASARGHRNAGALPLVFHNGWHERISLTCLLISFNIFRLFTPRTPAKRDRELKRTRPHGSAAAQQRGLSEGERRALRPLWFVIGEMSEGAAANR